MPTRRNFLKTSAALTAGVAASSLTATADPKQISHSNRWDRSADVVIVGSGIAGLCAAIEAVDAGASVIVLEKDAQPLGCAKFSGGHMSVAGTHVQARAGVEDKPEWLYRDMMEDSEMSAVPELIRKYAEGGPEHVMWLEKLGVRFENEFQYTTNADRIKKGVGRGHMIAQSPDYPGGPHNGGLGLMLMIQRGAEKRGVHPFLNHKMTRLVQEDDGRVVGVEVETGGKTLRIKANKAVLLTTGGWSGNLRMALAEDPRLTADIFPDCWPYHMCLGEGHVAAVDAGAELSNMSFGGYLVPRWGSRVYQIWEPSTFDSVPSIHTGVGITDMQRVILVNHDGKRWVNEMIADPAEKPLPTNPKFGVRLDSVPNHPFVEAYLNLPERPRNAWAVADAEGAKALDWDTEQMRNPNPRAGLALYPDMVATAGTLGDLAAKMKVDAAGLRATVERYNHFVDSGTDEEFAKPRLAAKISTGPFYAARLGIIKHTRRNGIRVNTRGQVLDRSEFSTADVATADIGLDNEKVIPHLYAAGECANYLGRYHGHGTLGIYSYYGRVAGKSAAAEKAFA